MNRNTFTSLIKHHLQKLYEVIRIGLIVFINGFFCFPEVSWVKSAFYILVLLPGLILLSIELKRFPFSDKFLLVFITLPVYLSLSHLWANEEYITRNFFFFFKQVIFIFILVFCFWAVIRVRKPFLLELLSTIVISGTAFAFISIIHHFLVAEERFFISALGGFSTGDSNKTAAYFTIHLALCCYFLIFNVQPFKSLTATYLITAAIILDIALILLTDAKAPWLIIPLIPLIFLLGKWKVKHQLTIWVTLIATATLCFFGFYSLESLLSERSVYARLDMWTDSISQIEDQFWQGLGLTYKLNLPNPEYTQLHSHNIFIDTIRFGGIIGLTFLVAQIYTIIRINTKEMKWFTFWYIAGIFLLSLYGQQPLTRPGYIWFLYWIPGVIILSNYLVLRKGN
ncbi:MAG: O-antigen ligase family protein [Chitinophagales bacterium]|nr:O-antigen ligase family protein [Chitinophagales bacterium]